MQRIVRAIEGLSTPAWVALAALCLVPPAIGWAAEGPLLLALTLAAAPAGGLLTGGTLARRWAAQLPLALAEEGLREGEGADAEYRFRVQLGRGRLLRDAVARVVWRRDGRTVDLPLVMGEVEALVGPWTLLATDPDGVVDGGCLDVYVSGHAQGKTWSTSATWEVAALREGRFAAPLVKRGGRWVLVLGSVLSALGSGNPG